MAKAGLLLETAFSTYTVTEPLGEGGSGRVYAVKSDEGKDLAAKVLDVAKATKSRVKRFKNEYLFGYRNEHANVLTVLDHGIIKDGSVSSPFYVMPRYSGSLRTLMNRGLAGDKVLKIFSSVLLGVEAAHLQGIVHRDIKPENILTNGLDVIVVADFGIARFEQEDLYTAVETGAERLANFQYAAPEQRIRGRTVDEKADIYALGLILNEMFTGDIPQGTDYKTVASVSHPHAWVDDAVAQMIRQSPGDRPQSIAAARAALSRYSGEFATRQRLDELKRRVVPTGAITDPLVANPVEITGADWDNGVLTLTLSQTVNQKWINALQNMGSYRSAMEASPERFKFDGSIARVGIEGRQAQDVVNYFKEWLPKATAVYGAMIRREVDDAERAYRAKIEREQKALEERQRVVSNLRI